MITNQAYLFFIFIINGIIIGLLFDFFRILRKSFKTPDIITYIEDLLFWILTGFIVLYSIFTFNNGEIRLYMILAIILGAIIYLLVASSYIIKINVTILNFIKKILKKIFNILLMPFKFLHKIINKIFIKPSTFLIINIRKFSTKLFNNFHNNSKKLKKYSKSWK